MDYILQNQCVIQYLCTFRQKKLENEIKQLSQSNSRLKEDLGDSEKLRGRLEMTVQQLRAAVKDLGDKLKVEKDEVRLLFGCLFSNIAIIHRPKGHTRNLLQYCSFLLKVTKPICIILSFKLCVLTVLRTTTLTTCFLLSATRKPRDRSRPISYYV